MVLKHMTPTILTLLLITLFSIPPTFATHFSHVTLPYLVPRNQGGQKAVSSGGCTIGSGHVAGAAVSGELFSMVYGLGSL